MAMDSGMMLIFKKISHLILGALALPFVLLIRILSPFVIVRIFVLDSGRVGHILMHLNMYVSRRDSNVNNSRTFDIFCFKRDKTANYQIEKMTERTVSVYPFAFWVDKVNRRIPGWEKHVVPAESRLDYDLDIKTSSPLQFTAKEYEYGQMELQKLGVPPNSPFVCFHAREASYLNTYQPDANWDYHSYRNADINNYVPAVERLVDNGYTAIRMGRHVSSAFKTNKPGIIDYATKGGTDFLDMYLSAHCRFFIAGSDGLAEMPTIFRRPVIWIDFVPLSPIGLVTSGQLAILKKYWSLEKNRFLTFYEMLHAPVAQFSKTEQFQEAGIKVIDNTPEEIMDVSMEMEERLNGTWNETEDDRQRQQQFRKIIETQIGFKFLGAIGAKYLRQNKELLGLSDSAKKDSHNSYV